MTERSDVDLMLACRAGDADAFELLVRRHQAAIVNLAYRYLLNRTDAEDLAQEIFLKVYRAHGRYRPDAKFTTWLYRIAVNACLNEVRNRKNRPTHGAAGLGGGDENEGAGAHLADGQAASPAAEAERSELREQVRRAVEDLPARQRLALLLNKFQGLGYEDLAEALDLSVPAVKSLLVRARENVRLRIEPYLEAGAGGRRRERKDTA